MNEFKEKLKNNTRRLTEVIDDELPENATIGGKGLIAILHATTLDQKEEWTTAGIKNALHERETAENQSPFETGDTPAPIEYNDSPISQIEENSRNWKAVVLAIRQSWKTYTHFDPVEIFVEFHRTHQIEYGVETDEILEKLGLWSEGRIDSEFQVRCFVLTLLRQYEVIERSNLTEREFTAFHLSARYRPQEVAQILTEVFDSEQSTGTVRKYNSRVRRKREQAEATIGAIGELHLTDEVPALTASEQSHLSDKQKRQISQTVQGIIETQGKQTEEVIELEGGIQLYIRPDVEFGDLTVGFYHNVSTLPKPVTVDEMSSVDAEKVSKAGEELTKFKDLSENHRGTQRDVIEALKYGLEKTKFYVPNDIDYVNFVSTTAIGGDDNEDGFVNFYGVISLS